jgi:hypothetical protein
MRVFASMSRRLASGQFYNALTWRIPWSQGKMQGISPIQPFLAKIRLENTCECNGLQTNSLRIGAGNYLHEQGINSAFPIGAGNLREIEPRASMCPWWTK